jgi:hypothetical protein
MAEKEQHNFCSILQKCMTPVKSSEISGRSKFRLILHNNWPVFFKSAKIMKDKDRLRNHQSEKTKDTNN